MIGIDLNTIHKRDHLVYLFFYFQEIIQILPKLYKKQTMNRSPSNKESDFAATESLGKTKLTFEERLLSLQQKRLQSQQRQLTDLIEQNKFRDFIRATAGAEPLTKPIQKRKMAKDTSGSSLTKQLTGQQPVGQRKSRVKELRIQLSTEDVGVPLKKTAPSTTKDKSYRLFSFMEKEPEKAVDEQYGPVVDRKQSKGLNNQGIDRRKKRQAVIATSASQRTLTLGKISKTPLTAKAAKKRPPLAHSKDSKPPKQPLTRRQEYMVKDYLAKISQARNQPKRQVATSADLEDLQSEEGPKQRGGGTPTKNMKIFEDFENAGIRALSRSSSPPVPSSDQPQPMLQSSQEAKAVKLVNKRYDHYTSDLSKASPVGQATAARQKQTPASSNLRNLTSRERRYGVEADSGPAQRLTDKPSNVSTLPRDPKNILKNVRKSISHSSSQKQLRNSGIQPPADVHEDPERASARQQSPRAALSNQERAKNQEDEDELEFGGQEDKNECELSFEKSERNGPQGRHRDTGIKLLEALKATRNSDNSKSNTSKTNLSRSKEFSAANRLDMPFSNEECSSRAVVIRGNLYGAGPAEQPTGMHASASAIAKSISSSTPMVYDSTKGKRFTSERPEVSASSKQGSEDSKRSQQRSLGMQLSSRISYKTQMTAGLSSARTGNQLYSSCQYDAVTFLNRTNKQVKPNSNSEKIILKRFNKEFTKILLDILNKPHDQSKQTCNSEPEDSQKHQQLPMYIQFDVFRALIDQMVFLKQQGDGSDALVESHQQTQSSQMQQQQGSVPSSEERIIKEMWNFLTECCKQERMKRLAGARMETNRDLEEEQCDEVFEKKDAAVGDVKVVLMAIFSIKGNKRMGIQPTAQTASEEVVSEYYQSLSLKNPLQFGWINNHNQLCLADCDIQKIQSKFGSLNATRMFIQGKKQAEKKRNSSREEYKYNFKPPRVESTNRSTSRRNTKRSTSRQNSITKTARKTDYERTQEQDQQKESPKPMLFDRLSRSHRNTGSVGAMRTSHEDVKQKLLDKYFNKGSAKQQKVVMQKAPAVRADSGSSRWPTRRSADTAPAGLSKPAKGMVKKTEITLSTLEKDKKTKREVSITDPRGRSPHGQLYLLDKNFRSYNSISQKRTHRQASNLLDRLCQSYSKGDRQKGTGQTQDETQGKRPTELARSPLTASLNMQKGQPSENLRKDPQAQSIKPLAIMSPPKAEPTSPKIDYKDEFHLRRSKQHLPDITEATRETPSIRHTVPSPIEKTERVDKNASQLTEKQSTKNRQDKEVESFQQSESGQLSIRVHRQPPVPVADQLSAYQAEAGEYSNRSLFKQSYVSGGQQAASNYSRSIPKGEGVKRTLDDDEIGKLIDKSKDSDQRYEQTKKAVEELFRTKSEKQDFLVPEDLKPEKEVAKMATQPKESKVTTPDQGVLSQASSSHKSAQQFYKIEEAKSHCIILKKNKGMESMKSGNRSPTGDNNIRNIIQQSLSSLKTLTQKSGSPGYSPISQMPMPNHTPAPRGVSRSPLPQKKPQKRSSKKRQSKPQDADDGEMTKKTVTISVEPVIRAGSPLKLKHRKDSTRHNAQAQPQRGSSKQMNQAFSQKNILDRQSLVNEFAHEYGMFGNAQMQTGGKQVIRTDKRS